MIRAWKFGGAGLALAVILLGPANAHADGARRCDKYSRVGQNTLTTLSSKPSVVCAVEIAGSLGPGSAQIIDSPDGTPTHGQAKYVADPSVTATGGAFSTGKIDRVTEFGLAVQTSLGVDVFLSWDEL